MATKVLEEQTTVPQRVSPAVSPEEIERMICESEDVLPGEERRPPGTEYAIGLLVTAGMGGIIGLVVYLLS